MSQSVHLSRGQQRFQFEIDDRIDLWISSQPCLPPMDDIAFADAVHNALQDPTDYPPVADGIVPGDVVAIVVDPELPQPAAAIAGVLRALAAVELSRIDVVIAESATDQTRATIREYLPPGVELTVHSGKSRDDLRYLAANEAADPVYLNRRIVDADLVIPVMVARSSDPVLASSTASPIFPALADYQSQFRAQLTAQDMIRLTSQRRSTSDDEAMRVGWLLGLQWTVSVEVNADGEPCIVYAGTPDLMAARSREHEAGSECPFAAEIVVACVDGGEQQQSIPNVLRAALAARAIAAGDATIVVVSDVAGLGTVADFDSESNELDDENDQEGPSQAAPWITATQHATNLLSSLINELDSSQRYLLVSQCDDEEVESFGFGAIRDVDSLARLINGHQSCSVIRSAQLASVKQNASLSDRPSGRR